MSWFRWRPGKGAGHDPQTAGEPPEQDQVKLRSLAFADLLRNLVSGGAYRFLDLGSASGQNIEGMSQYAASMQVGDLPASLASPRPHAVANALQSLEADAPESGYHVVLAWDLFNYLTPDELADAARRLAAVTRPGAFLFALIYYAKEMPADPPRYRIVDEATLSYPPPEHMRPAPRYPQGLIEQTFSDFELEHAYLLKTGVQEYLFMRRKPAEEEGAQDAGAGSGRMGRSS